MTAELKQKFVFNPERELKIFGIDLDEDLIKRAQESLNNEVFPKGLTFQPLDLMKEGAADALREFLEKQEPKREKFDVVFCFSVSMWIHLNYGDEGFEKFIRMIASLSKFVILEPQPWRCYQTANRRMRKNGLPVFEHLEQIGAKREELEPYILNLCEKNGLKKVKELGTTDWKRKAILFRNEAH